MNELLFGEIDSADPFNEFLMYIASGITGSSSAKEGPYSSSCGIIVFKTILLVSSLQRTTTRIFKTLIFCNFLSTFNHLKAFFYIKLSTKSIKLFLRFL